MLDITTLASTWPIAGDVFPLTQICQDQARTIRDQEALIHAYQLDLLANQFPVASSGAGTSSGTVALTVAAVTGLIGIGSIVTGPGVPLNTTIVGQQSLASGTTAPGGAGVYTTNQATTLNNIALTFTPGGGPMPWPTQTDAPTLNAIVQNQTAIIRTQSSLLLQYQSLMNTAGLPAPPTGP
jgi:hypothetical protein